MSLSLSLDLLLGLMLSLGLSLGLSLVLSLDLSPHGWPHSPLSGVLMPPDERRPDARAPRLPHGVASGLPRRREGRRSTRLLPSPASGFVPKAWPLGASTATGNFLRRPAGAAAPAAPRLRSGGSDQVALSSASRLLQCYEAIAQASQAMLVAARDDNWNDVMHLEAQCRQLIAELGEIGRATTLSRDEQRRRIALLRSILADDAEIRARSEPWLKQLHQVLARPGAVGRASVAAPLRPLPDPSTMPTAPTAPTAPAAAPLAPPPVPGDEDQTP